MTFMRYVVGFLVLMLAKAFLAIGTHLSRVGWWLGDREDMIVQQKHMIQLVKDVLHDHGTSR